VIRAPRGLGRGFSALGHRNFRLFWFGQLISLIGTWMQTVAQGWLVLEMTGDPLALGITAAVQFLPVLLLGLFGGLIADALPKRNTLYVTQGGSAVLALILGALVATGTVQVWMVWVLAAALGTLNAVDMPVRQSFVVEMVGREDVANAVALNSAVFNGARILGPAIGGVLIGIFGLAVCFLLNGLSYLAVLVGLSLMRDEELLAVAHPPRPRSFGAVAEQLAEGLRYVRRTTTILVAIGVLGIVSTVALNFQVLIPVYAQSVLHGDATTYGYLMAASGVGSLISALLIAFGLRPTLRLLLTGAALIGVALIALAFSPSLAVSLPIMGVLGWSVIAMAATTNTLIQLTVPDELRGRVMSVYTTVFAGSTPIGGLLSGLLAAAVGVAATLVLVGSISLATAGVAFARLPGLLREGSGPGTPAAEGSR
jgi:MFS family permease